MNHTLFLLVKFAWSIYDESDDISEENTVRSGLSTWSCLLDQLRDQSLVDFQFLEWPVERRDRDMSASFNELEEHFLNWTADCIFNRGHDRLGV